MRFADRRAAGFALAGRIPSGTGALIGLGRGGLAVAAAAAERLGLPLDVTVAVAIKPGGSTSSLGAVAAGGSTVLNQEAVDAFSVPRWTLEYLMASAAHIALSEERALRRDMNGGFPQAAALLVDDGRSGRFVVEAAARSLRERGVGLLGVAAPPGSQSRPTVYIVDRRPSEGDARQLLRAAARRYQELQSTSSAAELPA